MLEWKISENFYILKITNEVYFAFSRNHCSITAKKKYYKKILRLFGDYFLKNKFLKISYNGLNSSYIPVSKKLFEHVQNNSKEFKNIMESIEKIFE